MTTLPEQRAGVIEVCWVNPDDDNPDLYVVYGDGVPKAEARLVMASLSPLFDEFMKRGYDRGSFRFTVAKR